MKLTLRGVPPPKKNSRRIFRVGQKVVNIPSLRYSKWHDMAWCDMPKHIEKAEEPCSVRIEYWMPDRRRRDLSNITESIMDFLVDQGVLSDDNCSVVIWLAMRNMGRDKENPRTEIEICPSLFKLENWHTD